jgi:hypothetical protein
MSNKFEFQVVALDRYTKTLRDLNNKASQSIRPLTSIGRQMVALGREAHIDKAVRGIAKLSEGAVTLGERLGVSFGPLGMLTELGTAGGIAAGFGVAGAALAALAARAGSAGYEVSRTSRSLNLSTSDLQRYRGAANLAGVSTEDMTGSLASLGSTLHEAEMGRNNEAAAMLAKLGISIEHTADGAVNATPALVAMSRAISRVSDPYTQAVIASAFGLERALPLLRQGPEAMEKLAKKAEELGVVQGPKAIKWSEDFGDSLNRLKTAAGGVATEMGSILVPSVTRMMDTTADWWSGKGTSAGGRVDNSVDALLAPVRWAWDLGTAASGAPEGTTPEQRRGSGLVTDSTGNAAPLTNGRRDPMSATGPISPEVRDAARYVNGPLSLEQQQQVYNEVQQQVHIKVDIPNAPPGTKVTASTPAGFQPTRVSYSTAGDGSGP